MCWEVLYCAEVVLGDAAWFWEVLDVAGLCCVMLDGVEVAFGSA